MPLVQVRKYGDHDERRDHRRAVHTGSRDRQRQQGPASQRHGPRPEIVGGDSAYQAAARDAGARGLLIPHVLRDITSNTFAVGPEIAATTRFGRFFARYEFEFGAQNANEGQVFLFGWAALWDPFK